MGEEYQISVDGHNYADTPRIRQLIARGEIVRRYLPPVKKQFVRLWRGNRKDEIGKNPSFTNSLEGIALPFADAYGGGLTYVDIPAKDAEKYLVDGGAPDSEYIIPRELAANAKLIDEQEAREVLAMLEEISAATPEISWAAEIPNKKVIGSMTLPHDNLITGILSDGEDGIRRMYINVFQTNKRLQKRGIGTRLLKSLTAIAKKYGAITLSGHVTDISALKTRIGVIGWDKLKFYNHATGEQINLTQQEALNQKPNWNVLVNLSEIDTSLWELPVEK